MGIVQRQSLKNSIVNYSGVLVGGLSTMFIYPLDWDLYGEIQFILSTAILLSTLFSMGSHSIVTKYFPYFKKNNTKGLLSISFIYSGLSIILVFVLLFLFRHSFFNALEVIGINAEKIDKHLIVISCLGVMMVFITILRTQSFNFQRIVAPDLISNFSLKVFLPIVILLSYFSVINNDIASWLIALFYVVILITLLLYLHALGGLDFKLSTLKRIKIAKHIEMIRYMMYNAMNHVGNVLVYKIDIVMVGLLLTNTKVGYYSIFLFLSVIIEIPTKAVFHITGPMISNAFENNNMSEIRKLYKSSSINLFVVGTVLFALIWMNIDTFFNIMTNGEDLIMYKYIFVVLAFTKLIDMVTSVNFHIISYSKYFRINTLFMAILAILNIVLNYYFIGTFDILGAALSTGVSMFLFNVLKTLFILIKYKMHPFNWKLTVPILFLLVSLFLPILLPEIFNRLIYSMGISIGLLILFIISIYRLKVSTEINKIIYKYWKKGFN